MLKKSNIIRAFFVSFLSQAGNIFIENMGPLKTLYLVFGKESIQSEGLNIFRNFLWFLQYAEKR